MLDEDQALASRASPGAGGRAGPSRASQVVLGIIPGATARAPMPACGDVNGEPCRRSDTPVPAGRLTI